jgi:hopanoid biosynthesis associated protein HpnK
MTAHSRPPHDPASAAFARSKGSASAFLNETSDQQAARDVRTSTQRRLIVNADDFGMSEEVNEAVIRAYKEGVLTSTSLMVTGAAFENAVKLAREHSGLAVGIHLVTVVGKSVLPHSEIPTLVDCEGNFSNNPVAAGLRYYFSMQSRRELRKELAAQFDRFRSSGLPLSHIDGHLHLHVHPVIFNAALALGAEYGSRHMRVPVEERSLALAFDDSNSLQKTIYTMLFSGLGRYMKSKLRKRGFTSPERVYGNLQSGRMSERYCLYVLDRLTAEISEIYFHPAVYDDQKVLNSEERQCSIEFEALISMKVKQRMQELGIELTNYFEI